MKFSKKAVALGAGLVSVVTLGIAGGAGAWAAGADPAEPPSIVEDYSYPGADTIMAEKGIKLIKGSGTITLTDCPATLTNQIIWVNTLSGYVCFKASSNSGYLTMEIDEVFSIRGDTNNGSAKVTVDDETETVQLEKGAWRGVGVGEDETRGLAVLLEIRLTA
ncbi:hypothetical protein AB0B10_28575 [Micromonospora arborensis]|uniref:hypothetical protein n=1 Tax=Micromonospora arborensis TaxID=2116518 RepID=UPI0033ED4FE9